MKMESDDIVALAERPLGERERDGVGDWHDLDLPISRGHDLVVLDAHDILGRPRDGSETIDGLLRTARPVGGKEWAETGGTDGQGTKTGPEKPEKILSLSEFMGLTAAVSTGVGVRVAVNVVGTEAIIASGALFWVP